MKNPFREKDVKKAKLVRNRWDLSHFNNMTMDVGKLYPNLVIETLPKDSFRIKTAVGFNQMPVVYPLQTQLYFNQYFFYGRNRAVWDGWKDFITMVKDKKIPYLELKQGSEQAAKILTTGSLGDYMGVPTINEAASEVEPFVGFNLFSYDGSVTGDNPYRVQTLKLVSFNVSDFLNPTPSTTIDWLNAVDYSQPIRLGSSSSLAPVIYPIQGDKSNVVSSTGYRYLLSLWNLFCFPYPLTSDVLPSFDDVIRFNSQRFAQLVNLGFSVQLPFTGRHIYSIQQSQSYDFSAAISSYIDGTSAPSEFSMPFGNTTLSFSQFALPLNMNFNSIRIRKGGSDWLKVLDTGFSVVVPQAAHLDEIDDYIRENFLAFLKQNTDIYNPSEGSDCRLSLILYGANSLRTYRLIDGVGRFSIVEPLSVIDRHYKKVVLSMYSINEDAYDDSIPLVTADEPVLGMLVFQTRYFVGQIVANFLNRAAEGGYFVHEGWFHSDAFHTVEDSITVSPFTSSINEDGTTNPPEIPINALPFRIYESIFNSYFRNQKLDPLRIDGEVEYNVFNSNKGDGADDFVYDFINRYWEPDVFTSCLPSPQQGVAPLVGVNSVGSFTFEDENGNQYTAQPVVGEDGETLTGIEVQSPDLPVGSLKALVSYINHGMSINDFRNVNALQRYLETNIRQGYRYRDLMKAHHGIVIRFDELDMPEYFGGFSVPLSVGKIINSDAQGEVPLGQFAGLGSIDGKSNHPSSVFCDEHGYIIGLCSITPVPIYSQMLPKHFIKQDALDFYSNEFAKIGMQPLDYREVTPINRYFESRNDGSKSVSDVFGYQKPWYEYMSMLDEAHGEFRATLRNYIYYRMFGSSPELGKEFITVDRTSMNNIYATDSPLDKFTGQVYFDIVRKSQILRNVQPALE